MSETTQIGCLLADASVFVGMTSMPAAEEKEFLREMEQFFAHYRDRRARHFPKEERSEFTQFFYVPSPYAVIGSFDLAFLSLYEDFEFPVQVFHQFNPKWVDEDGAPEEQDKAYLREFAHRTIIGPCPRWDGDEWKNPSLYAGDDQNKGRALMRLAKQTFLRPVAGDKPQELNPAPLVGICQVEVNNSLLIGGGTNFLRCLIRAIRAKFQQEFRHDGTGDATKSKDAKTHVIILESYSWHELTLLVFSNSFAKIDKMVMLVREMDMFAMGKALCRQQWKWDDAKGRYVEDAEETETNRAEWEALIRLPCVYDLRLPKKDGREGEQKPAAPGFVVADLARTEHPDPRLGSAALAGATEATLVGLRGNEKLRPFGVHTAFNTTTSVGFSTALLRGALKVDPKETTERKAALEQALTAAGLDEEKDLCIIRRWMAKAGHDQTAIKVLGCEDRKMLTLGREDFVCPCTTDGKALQNNQVGFDRISTRELVRLVAEGIIGLDAARLKEDDAETAAGLLAGRSTVGVLNAAAQSGSAGECPAHASASRIRDHYAFKWSEVVGVRDNMRRLWMPKVLEERVLNSLALFNEGIKDNFLFSSFLELRGYLALIRERIQKLAEAPPVRGGGPNDWAEQLGSMLDLFEAGWRNRTHGGWRMGEVSDFNFEFKGGIQQLVSAFHGATQKLMWYFTGRSDALAVIAGQPGIEAFGQAVSLNLFDITRPEFFAARIGHEVAEVLITLCRTESTLRDVLACLTPTPDLQLPNTPLVQKELDQAMARRAHLVSAMSLTGACAGIRSGAEPLSFFADTASGQWLRGNLVAGLTVEERDLLAVTAKAWFGFFDEVFADRCNFARVYRHMPNLYSCWMFASAVTDSTMWRAPAVVDKRQARGYILRFLFTMESALPREKHPKAVAALKSYWRELEGWGYPTISEEVDILARICAKWLSNASIREWSEAVAQFELDGLLPWELRRECAWQVPLRRKLTELVDDLSRGSAIRARSQPAQSPALMRWQGVYDMADLLHAYLWLIKDRSDWGRLGDDGRPLRLLLPRTRGEGKVRRSGEPEGIDRGKYAKLLLSQRGGTYTYDAGFRRKYFMWRCAFVMSLLDLSEKSKFHECLALSEALAVRRSASARP